MSSYYRKHHKTTLTNRYRSVTSWVFILFFLPISSVRAVDAPNAGGLLQQNSPRTLDLPVNQDIDSRIEQSDTDPENRTPNDKRVANKSFAVQRIHISGNTQLASSELHALVASEEGQTLTLADLDVVAMRLTDYYRKQGYLLTRAIIPAQVVSAGVVRIEIIEARYGEIILNNSTRVQSRVLQGLLSPLARGQLISQRGLDQALLQLSDIRGIEVDSTLKPGGAVGSTDLHIRALPLPAITGNVVLDNFGNRYTGIYRISTALSYSNPLKWGDTLNMNTLNSVSGIQYGRLAYETLINGNGSRIGISFSDLNYKLGEEFALLQAHGNAQTQSVWFRHPLRRSRESNIYGQLQYDNLKLHDMIDSAALQNLRQIVSMTASLNGDARDALLAGGLMTWNLSMTTGQTRIGDTAAQQNDAASAKTEGNFSKWNGGLTRLQNLSSSDSLFFSLSGQAALANLDSSQKMTVGGPYNVRAYAMGAKSGDSAALFSAELRHELRRFAQGQLTASAFFDGAYVITNANPWVAGNNHVRLYGAGLGLNWAHPQLWNLRSIIAMPLWAVETDKTTSSRLWVTLSKGF